MAHNAYCNECATRVPLTESGACAFGHPRSALRDVREGEFTPDPAKARSDGGAPPGGGQAIGAHTPTSSQEMVSAVLGKLIVVVPALAVIAIGLWSGYAIGESMGQSKLEAWSWSIASMLMTGVVVAMVVWNRRRKMNR